jgi:hypothetical protein|tara:strand:+ start:45 stop:968 length:924 start_codon:yes stop_codon:yes gene_type:complete
MTNTSKSYDDSSNYSNNLNSTHEQTLSNIENLQKMERSMYAELDTSTNNKKLTQTQQQEVIDKINELSTMRTNLFQTLQQDYTLETNNVSHSRNDLVNQLTAVGIIENELNNAKKTLSSLENERYNQLRMVEINNYYGKQYEAQADVMKWIVILCVPLLIIAILINKRIIPSRLGGQLIALILVFGLVFIGLKIWDISMRDNMNFDQYNWFWSAESQNPTVYEYDKNQIKKWGGTNTNAQSIFEKALGTCIGDTCCSDGTKWNKKKDQCVEAFNKIAASTYNRRKDSININENNVKPYTLSNNHTFV